MKTKRRKAVVATAKTYKIPNNMKIIRNQKTT
jgi:hypothetical protein